MFFVSLISYEESNQLLTLLAVHSLRLPTPSWFGSSCPESDSPSPGAPLLIKDGFAHCQPPTKAILLAPGKVWPPGTPCAPWEFLCTLKPQKDVLIGLARERNFSGAQMQVKPGLTGFTFRPEKSHRNRREVSAAS